MTLTTERQQFEQWWETAMHNGYPPRFGWEHWRDGNGYRDDDGEFQRLWQAWQASRKLANREAQPLNGWRVTVNRTGDRHGVASISGPGVFCMEVPVEFSMLDFMESLTAPPAPANAQIAGYFVRQRPEWDKRAPWTQWKEVDEASYADIIKIIATGEAYCGWFYDNRILYTAPPAPAVQDEIDSFADQVIGTKDKIIRLPAPMPVPLEGIRVYLNADAIISYLEKQGYIVEVSRE